MTDAETVQALERIDRALGRIEAVAGSAASREVTADTAPDTALAERHERFRARVQATLVELDAVLLVREA